MSHRNDELMREVRRRLSLGAATGEYLTNPASFVESDASAATRRRVHQTLDRNPPRQEPAPPGG